MSRNRRGIAVFFVMVLPLVLAGVSTAGTYYVSPAGLDGNPGTQAQPWSISKANTTMVAGDTAILMDGQYTMAIAPINSGNDGAPIIYRSMNNRGAKFDGLQYAAVVTLKSWIVIDGIQCNNGYRWVVGEGGSSHITITNCHFENSSGWESIRFHSTGGYITVTNNYIYWGTDSVHIRSSQGHYIAGNTFIGAEHTDLTIMDIDRSVIENNTLTNTGEKCMEVFSERQYLPPNEKKCEYDVIQNNVFHDNNIEGTQYAGSSCILRWNTFVNMNAGQNFGGYGGTDPGDDPEAWWDQHNRFYNNVMYNCTSAIGGSFFARLLPLGGAFGDNVSINNIIAGGTSATQVNIGSQATPADMPFFRNNIIRADGGQQVFSWDMGNPLYTLAEMQAAFPGSCADNMSVQPQFVNAAAGDFHLAGGSPMIDAGRPLTYAKNNGSGTVVPVEDVLFFTDGCGLIAPDVIRVGSQKANIVSINYAAKQLTLDRSVYWTPGMGVTLDFKGSAPDLGAFESAGQSSALVGRYVFYNDSAFDGNNAAANAADDAAIATDKTALLPGQTASFANYTSYSHGINGIMVDIANLPGAPIASDFVCLVGNSTNKTSWVAAPAPSQIAVRSGAGVGGSDRVTVIWADDSIQNKWLEVTVKASVRTGLVGDETFRFGNAMGETGNSLTDASVTPADQVATRNNGTGQVVDAANHYDFNRDQHVTPTDEIICRNNGRNSMTGMQMIDMTVNQAPRALAGDDETVTLPTNTVHLYGTVIDDGLPKGAIVTAAWSKVSGPGSVNFANPGSDTTMATFSAAGVYVLRLQASDGDLTGSDTVQITVVDAAAMFFADNFEDGNMNGWTTLEGSFQVFQFQPYPGYEVHGMVRDSRMSVPLTSTALSDKVYISFTFRHTGEALGYKRGVVYVADGTGKGIGVYVGLGQTDPGSIDLATTADAGNTYALPQTFGDIAGAGGTAKKTVVLVFDRVNNTMECIYQGSSMATLDLPAGYANFNQIVANLYNEFDGWYGQLDLDDFRVASTPP